VLEDFARQLGEVSRFAEFRYLAVTTNSSEEIAQAIRAAKGEIVVLIRSGGSPQDFEPFNDERVVEAWMDKDAFTVSALGHSGDVTLLDPLSDLSCPTPTAAGAEVRERLLEGIDRSAALGAASDYSRQNRDVRRLKLALALACALAGLLLLLLLLLYGATAASP
jgi:exonuclease VII large subunit